MSDLFDGRVGRGYFFVGTVVIAVIAEFIKMTYYRDNTIMSIAYLIVAVILLTLFISLYARRLHDVGRSGYWSFLLFVPFVNLALFVYLVFKSGEKKKNHYGVIPAAFNF